MPSDLPKCGQEKGSDYFQGQMSSYLRFDQAKLGLYALTWEGIGRVVHWHNVYD